MSRVSLSLFIALCVLSTQVESAEPTYFEIGEHQAFVFEPPTTARLDGPMPWVWYAPTFIRRLPGPEEDWMIQRLHERGIAIAGVDVGESYGSPTGREAYQLLYENLTSKRDYREHPVLLARSRGGLMLYNWAVEHPRAVGGVAGIYPVCNIESYPGVAKAAGAYGLTAKQLQAKLLDHNPIHRLEPLAKAKVPILHIHGDRDHVVPLEQNSAELAKNYRRLGGPVETKVIKGQGHNMWQGWFQHRGLTDFIIDRALATPPKGKEGGDSPSEDSQEQDSLNAGHQETNDPRGAATSSDFVVVRSENLEVTIGNNKSLTRNGQQHNAGYNGIFSITSTSQPESPFVPAYAGINLEHYFDGSGRQESEVFFEPRHAPMRLRRLSPTVVELYQSTTPVYQVESWTRFSVAANHIDFSFRCRPHRENYSGDFLGTFWASYLNGPLNKSIYFLDAQSNRESPVWRQFNTQAHNRDSTVVRNNDTLELEFDATDTLFANISPLKFSAPFFYGRFRNMVLIYVFQPDSTIRFSHSPTGGGRSAEGNDTNPAWDFQFIIPQPKAGQDYRLDGRLIYKRWKGREDVLQEVAAYLKSNQ